MKSSTAATTLPARARAAADVLANPRDPVNSTRTKATPASPPPAKPSPRPPGVPKGRIAATLAEQHGGTPRTWERLLTAAAAHTNT
ncbi:hypothetical protein [Streptomyces exfoliatus]|uniref:hypothetical protein n=1 Tax=Streptomyces exfoliatus TaxID=1905 RepID=UPI0012FE9BD8|nr:hypothetical protein [Streptomyces exfoliatus]